MRTIPVKIRRGLGWGFKKYFSRKVDNVAIRSECTSNLNQYRIYGIVFKRKRGNGLEHLSKVYAYSLMNMGNLNGITSNNLTYHVQNNIHGPLVLSILVQTMNNGPYGGVLIDILCLCSVTNKVNYNMLKG